MTLTVRKGEREGERRRLRANGGKGKGDLLRINTFFEVINIDFNKGPSIWETHRFHSLFIWAWPINGKIHRLRSHSRTGIVISLGCHVARMSTERETRPNTWDYVYFSKHLWVLNGGRGEGEREGEESERRIFEIHNSRYITPLLFFFNLLQNGFELFRRVS